MLLISNGKSVSDNGSLACTEEQLKLAGVEAALFAGIGANPTKTAVMDAVKAIAIMMPNDGDLWDYVSGAAANGLCLKTRPSR